mgnify:CR=1 FL=1
MMTVKAGIPFPLQLDTTSTASNGSTAALSTKLDTIETKVDEVKAIVKKTASAKIVWC